MNRDTFTIVVFIVVAIVGYFLGYNAGRGDVEPEVVTETIIDTVAVPIEMPPIIVTKVVTKPDTATVNAYRAEARKLLEDKEQAEARVAELLAPIDESFPFSQKGVTGIARVRYTPLRAMVLDVDIQTIPQITVNTTTTITKKPAGWVKPAIAAGAAAAVLLAQEKEYGWAIGASAVTIGLITLEF